jgi:hypothetical protein
MDLERVAIDGKTIVRLERGTLPPTAHSEQNPESYLIPRVTEALDAGHTAEQANDVAMFLELDPLVPAETIGKVLYSSVQAEQWLGSKSVVALKIGERDSFEITLPTITSEPPKLSEPTRLKPLHATVAISREGIYVAADGRNLEGPRDCDKNLTFCDGQGNALEDSVEALRGENVSSDAKTEYLEAVASYHWNELNQFWSSLLESHPSEEYKLRETLNVSMESWMPVEMFARIHETTCVRDTTQGDSGCDRYFETFVFNLVFAE